MTLLWACLYKLKLSTKQRKPSPTILCDFPRYGSTKVPSLLTTRDGTFEGSMTIEAAVVLPIVIGFLLLMGSIIEMIRLHGKIQLELCNLGNQISMYGYLEDKIPTEDGGVGEMDIASMFTAAHISIRLQNELGAEYLRSAPIEYGENGLLTWVNRESGEDTVEIIVTYFVRPFQNSLGFPKFRMVNKYYGHIWNGFDISESGAASERMVYVTEHGSVYHLNSECTYIEIDVTRIDARNLPNLRTLWGTSYEPCEKCRRQQSLSHYYITSDGERYHCDVQCPALKRTVISIPQKEAGDYTPCQRCSAENDS